MSRWTIERGPLCVVKKDGRQVRQEDQMSDAVHLVQVAFEKGDCAGGLWVQDNSSGLAAAYDSLHLNTSKGRTEFADFPMPEEWPDYPAASLVAGYLAEYADTFGVTEHIRFGTTVADVNRVAPPWRRKASRSSRSQ